MPYALSIEGCRSEVIGTAGLTPAKLELWLRRVEPHLARLRVQYEDGSLPLLRIARATADIAEADNRSRTSMRCIVFALIEGAQHAAVRLQTDVPDMTKPRRNSFSDSGDRLTDSYGSCPNGAQIQSARWRA